jgi:cellulose synthase (UDP-forming)
MVPSMLATLFVFPMIARGWRPGIYRVCTINSVCHLLAVFHALRDRVEEWVPTGLSRRVPGAGARKLDVPAKINRILVIWIVVEQTLLWTGIVLRWREGGLVPYWATAALAAVQLVLLAPLLTPGKGLRERHSAKKRVPDPVQGQPVNADATDMTVEMERIR